MSKPGGAGISLKLGQLKLKSSKPKPKVDNNQQSNNAVVSTSAVEIASTSQPNASTSSNLIQSDSPAVKECDLAEKIRIKRFRKFQSVLSPSSSFNMRRVRFLSQTKTIPAGSNGILYWMSREQRVQDNWSLLYAQKLALENRLPLYVCFCMVPTFLNATYRMYHFMLEGLKEVQKELNQLNIPFYILIGQAKDQLPSLVRQNRLGAVVCDFTAMRIGMVWINELTKSLPQIALLAQVDSHNIVPCWLASDKREPSAAAIRPKLKAHLDEFFTEIPPLIAQNSKPSILNMTGIKIYEQVANCYSILECDMSVKEVKWTKPGYLSGIETLQEFINDVRRLALYEQNKNDPNDRAQSGLSPWLHFGQISIQRCMLETRERSARCAEAVEWFFDQGVIRRELAENFCYYDPDYDNVNAAPQWALATLRKHQSDKREALYSLKQLDVADTYDSLWNACQLQMRLDGKMHGYMRMYWAKKILEWTETPEQALEFTIYLNDRYSLDGRDPNGYAGIQWSLMGVHDKPFDERPVHGTVRGMTSQGCRRKFDVDLYVSRFINRRNEL